MKKIAYLVTDSGIEGRDSTKVLYATWTEEARAAKLAVDKSRNWRSTDEKIVDLESARAAALAKLDGVDRLVLNLPPWPEKVVDNNSRSV